MTSLAEALVARRSAAVDRATEAAAKLRRADSPQVDLQAALELALGDVERYDGMGAALTRHARAGGPYAPGSGASCIADQLSMDPEARIRLRQAEAADRALAELEGRAIGTAAFVGVTIPQYLTDLAAPVARAGAPLLHALASPLVPDGMQLLISTWTTPTGAAPQSGENLAIANTNLAQGTATINVRTYAASITLSRQVVDRAGPGFDAQVLPDLLAALDAKLELDLIGADGTGGTLLGVLAAPGTSAVTYTSASPTGAAFVPQLEKMLRTSGAARGNAYNMIAVAHSRRWSWLRERVVAEGLAPLVLEEPTLPAAIATYGGNVELIVSDAIPTNLGVGTNEDRVFAFPADVFPVFASAPTVEVAPEPGAGVLNVLVLARRYVACLVGRGLPAAVAILGGTGLTAP